MTRASRSAGIESERAEDDLDDEPAAAIVRRRM